MRRIVFATNNSHKLSEVRELLADKFEVVSLSEVGFNEEVEESATTLEGNALLKARALYQTTALDCFADDTGLEVESLGGAPGVRSARFAGEDNNSEANMALLLKRMDGVESRTARFRTVIALILSGEEYLFEGVVDGEITLTRSGEEGFGYDPIFKPCGEDITFAQMSSAAKSEISHRGRAVRRLIDFLSK